MVNFLETMSPEHPVFDDPLAMAHIRCAAEDSSPLLRIEDECDKGTVPLSSAQK